MSVSSREMEILSRQITQIHRAVVQAEMNAAGLGEVGHPMLLSILESYSDCGGCRAQKELAELLHVSPAAVATSLKSLEKGGYIRREPGAGDARRNQVFLTEKGVESVRACRQVLEDVSSRMLRGFSEQEREQLVSFRQRMLDNLRANPEEKEE